MLATLPAGVEVTHYQNGLMVPGFIDTHIHYPQTEMIASYGLQLLDWLKQYTFPTEEKFAEREYADRIAEFYCEQLLRNGTTTSAVFATVHPESVDAIFEAARRRDMCLIAGKVMMDRNAPASLRDEAQQSYRQSAELIQRWHRKTSVLPLAMQVYLNQRFLMRDGGFQIYTGGNAF